MAVGARQQVVGRLRTVAAFRIASKRCAGVLLPGLDERVDQMPCAFDFIAARQTGMRRRSRLPGAVSRRLRAARHRTSPGSERPC